MKLVITRFVLHFIASFFCVRIFSWVQCSQTPSVRVCPESERLYFPRIYSNRYVVLYILVCCIPKDILVLCTHINKAARGLGVQCHVAETPSLRINFAGEHRPTRSVAETKKNKKKSRLILHHRSVKLHNCMCRVTLPRAVWFVFVCTDWQTKHCIWAYITF